MELEELGKEARTNLKSLSENPYPGRGIIVGLDETGKNLVQVYWIMGRSLNSRNRVFRREEGRVFTEAVDLSKVKDPSLIFYNAMQEFNYVGCTGYVVSNGNQTDKVADGYYSKGRDFYTTMRLCEYEPDEPNFTPRITALCSWNGMNSPNVLMSILRKSPWSMRCDRHLYEISDIGPGFGYGVTTYSGDGYPLPAFKGEPLLFPLWGNATQIAELYWCDVLDGKNKVAIAVKFVPKKGPSEIVIINKGLPPE